MDKVFITHSRHDAPVLSHVLALVKEAGVEPLLYQYDPSGDSCAWNQIRDAIRDSGALFVVLSSNLSSSAYTQNWVAFEVGVAAALQRPVWVFEELGGHVPFPIPYLTDYMPYDLGDPNLRALVTGAAAAYNLEKQRQGIISGGLLGGLLQGAPGMLVGAALGALTNAPKGPQGASLICYHLDCKTRFNLYVDLREFPCPACRRQLRFSVDTNAQGAGYLIPAPRPRELMYTEYCWPDGTGTLARHPINYPARESP